MPFNWASSFLLANRMKECVGVDVGVENQQAFEEQRRRLSIQNCRFLRLDIEQESIDERDSLLEPWPSPVEYTRSSFIHERKPTPHTACRRDRRRRRQIGDELMGLLSPS
jgi:hypothetical protein